MSDPLSSDAVPYTPSGVRGVRMETFLRGGRRFVLRSAIVAFIEAVTAAADGATSQVRPSRNNNVEKATQQLREQGM